MLTSCYQLFLKTLTAELFDQRAWKWRGVLARSLLRHVRRDGNPATRGSGSNDSIAGLLTARREEAGRDHVPCK